MKVLISALIGVALAASPALANDNSNEDAIRHHYELLNAGKYEQAALDFADAVAHQGQAGTRAGRLRALKDIYATFPDWRMEILDVVAAGDSVVVRSEVSGTHRGMGKLNINGGLLIGVPPTGKSFEVEHIHWYKMADGKIVEHFAARNDIGMSRQLGVLAPASPAIQD